MGRGKVRASPVDLLAEGRAGKVSLARPVADLPVADLPGEAAQAASMALEAAGPGEAPAAAGLRE